MIDEEVMDALPKLSIGAALLVIYRLANPDRPISRDEYCDATGLTHSGYHKAIRRLEELGVSARMGIKSARMETLKVPVRELSARMDTPEVPAWTPVPARTLRELIEAADEMPGDGDKTQKSSNFQARRREQVRLLQRAWRELKLDENGARLLSESACRTWLGWFEERAETILGYMEQVALLAKDGKVRAPYSYLNSILNRERVMAARPDLTPTQVRQAIPAANEADDLPLETETPEHELARLHKLAALGFLFDGVPERIAELEALVA